MSPVFEVKCCSLVHVKNVDSRSALTLFILRNRKKSEEVNGTSYFYRVCVEMWLISSKLAQVFVRRKLQLFNRYLRIRNYSSQVVHPVFFFKPGATDRIFFRYYAYRCYSTYNILLMSRLYAFISFSRPPYRYFRRSFFGLNKFPKRQLC